MNDIRTVRKTVLACVVAAWCQGIAAQTAAPASQEAAAAPAAASSTAPAADKPPVADAAQAKNAKTLAAMSVTGIRRANDAAIDSKRSNTNISDVVSATDVRALPDATIVEALRRVPGISVLPATDNEHPRDEAATPVIRGLGPSYNNVTIDGLTIASPGTPNGTLGSITRGVRLDILPSSMVSELQVLKTFTPDLDPNATGGAVNLKTRSAFENGGKPFFTMESSVGHANDNGKPRDQDDPGYRFNATGSTTFGSEHQYGLTLSGNFQTLSSYTETHMTTDTVQESFYNNSGLLRSGTDLGNGYAVPQQDKYWYVTDKRDRYGLTAKFEAKFSDELQGYATAGYYYFKDNMARNELIIDPRNRNMVFNQTPTSGTYPVGDVEVGYSNQVITTRTKMSQAGLDWHPDDHQVLSAKASWSDATYDEPIHMYKYITGAVRPAAVPVGTAGAGETIVPTSAYGFTYDTSQFNQSFPISPQSYYNYSNYSLLYWRPDYKRTADDKILTGRLDYAFNRGESDRGFGFGTGVAYTTDKPSYNIYRDEFQPNVNAPALKITDVLAPSNAPMRYVGLNMITIDPKKAQAILSALPLSDFNATDQSAFSNQDNFSHEEKIFGAYGDVGYRSDDFDVLAGLHYDDTQQSTVGRERELNPATGQYGFVDVPTHSSYNHVLPSAIMTYHLNDNLDLRAAASRTLGRPPYDAYAARTSISFVNTGDIGNPNAQGVTVTIGNPAIKPRVSTNLDLALDWQLPGDYDGMLSAAAFNKHIQDEIFTLSTLGTFAYNGTTYNNVFISTPSNASRAQIRGLEFSGVLNSLGPIVPWLSHFGVSGNVALLDGGLNVPYSTGSGTQVVQQSRHIDRLVGQPNYTANASVFYTLGGLELRAAFNRQGKALRSVVSNIAWQDLYWAPRSQLDLTATYALTKEWSVLAQVSNVTHSRITSFVGPNENLLKDSYSMPTTYWFGVRYTPKF